MCSKSGKLSSCHRNGKGQFSFQSQKRGMPKNVQPTAQLHSSHTPAKQCSKSSKSGFNIMWIMNFQMYRLDLEKAEEPEIKFQTSIGSQEKQESFRKASTSALLTMLKPLTVWITKNVENSSRDGNTRPPYLTPDLLYAGQKSTVRTGCGKTDWFQIGKGIC